MSCQDKIRCEKHANNSHQTVITPICVSMQAATGPGGLQSVELLHFKGLNKVQHGDSAKMQLKKHFYLRTNKKWVRKCAFNMHSSHERSVDGAMYHKKKRRKKQEWMNERK